MIRTVSMLCVYSVNMCSVSRWIAVLIVLSFKCPLDYYGVVSENRWFHENDSADSRACGSLLKEAGKRGNEERQSEKNVKPVKS